MARSQTLIIALVLCLATLGQALPNSCRLDVDDDGLVHVSYMVTMVRNTTLTMRFLHEPGKLEVRTGSGMLPFDYTPSSKRLSVHNPYGGPITIKYDISGLVKSDGRTSTLAFIPHFTQGITYSVALPERAHFLPRNSTIPSQHLVEARIVSFDDPSGIINVSYRLGGEMALALPIVFLVFALGWAAYLVTISRNPEEGNEPEEEEVEPTRGLDYVLKTLDDTEKAIVQELLKSDGELLQTTIRSRLNLDKYPLSRALQRLERKKVVIKERVGKINRIRMNRWLLDQR